MIKNISFDLWLTLIKSHPLFKEKRAELIATKYNSKGLTVEQIDTLIRKLDKVIDWHNEQTGGKIPAKEMYCTVLQFTHQDVDERLGAKLEQEANELFIEYCPVLLNKNIPTILSALVDKGYVLNIASNTGFIEADTLRIVLEKMELLQYFKHQIFSDEAQASKPSAKFFEQVYENIDAPKDQVLHIGDNNLTDYQGAKDFGFNALHIINRNYTINDIIERL